MPRGLPVQSNVEETTIAASHGPAHPAQLEGLMLENLTDAQAGALIGFIGSLVGAVFALGGTWLTLWHTQRKDETKRRAEVEQKNYETLREAYAQWLAALEDGILSDISTIRVLLTEPDPVMQRRVAEVIDKMRSCVLDDLDPSKKMNALYARLTLLNEITDELRHRFTSVPIAQIQPFFKNVPVAAAEQQPRTAVTEQAASVL
jgi:hypothetical protein